MTLPSLTRDLPGIGGVLTDAVSWRLNFFGGLPFAIPYKTHPALIPQYVDLLDGDVLVARAAVG